MKAFGYAVLVALALMVSVRPAAAQAVSSSKVGWTQNAPDLATAQGYSYTHYDDNGNAGVALAPATCADQSPVKAGTYDCQAPFPAFTPGAHTIAITAKNVAGESLKSTALAFTFIVLPSAPTNVHIL